MTNKFISQKIEQTNYDKILSLSEQTKNLFTKRISPNNKILLKIKLKSPIHRVKVNKIRINKTKDFNNRSKFYLDNDLDNYKNNIGFINYKLSQPNNYLINSNKLIDNISKLNNSYNDKNNSNLPNINNNKLRNKSLVQTMKKFDLTTKKIYLKDLSKDLKEKKEVNNIKLIVHNKIKPEEIKINKKQNRLKLKKLLLLRNSTNYKLENNNRTLTEKNNRNSKLLKKYYNQKMMNYNKLIKKMEEETELKKNVMNEYINLMKENVENGLKFD